jgi:hypothetical protein
MTAPQNCLRCERPVRAKGTRPDGRTVALERRGLCVQCVRRCKLDGTIADYEPRHGEYNNAAMVEDFYFIAADVGTRAPGIIGYDTATRVIIAGRLGINRETLDKALYRYHRNAERVTAA